MAEWIQELKRKISLRKEERKVVLVLDSAKCHSGDVIDKVLENSNITILMIPGGCTSFLQPLDTSIFKGVKHGIRKQYLEWLVAQHDKIGKENVLHGNSELKGPEFKDIRQWFCSTMSNLSRQSIANSFVTCGITFGIENFVHLNSQLQENWQKILALSELELEMEEEEEKENENPYLDQFEHRLKFTLKQDEIIVSNQELDDDEIEENKKEEEKEKEKEKEEEEEEEEEENSVKDEDIETFRRLNFDDEDNQRNLDESSLEENEEDEEMRKEEGKEERKEVSKVQKKNENLPLTSKGNTTLVEKTIPKKNAFDILLKK